MSQAIPIATGVPAEFPNGSARTTQETMLQRAARILAGDIREEDYLSMMDEIRQALALSEAYIRDERKGELIGESRLRHIQDLLLDFHHGGQMVVAHRTSQGVSVLAVGERIRELLDSLSAAQLLKIVVESPDVW